MDAGFPVETTEDWIERGNCREASRASSAEGGHISAG